MWFLIPARNLTRNVRRTALSLAIIGLGAALSFVVLGFVFSSIDIIQDSLLKRYSNVQIARQSVWEEGSSELSKPITSEDFIRLKEIIKETPEIANFSSQLSFLGLLVKNSTSQPVRIIAVEPGSSVINYADSLISGRGLESGDRKTALIGETLSEKLEIATEDTLRVIVDRGDGESKIGTLKVAGVYRAQSEEVEGRQIYIPLPYGQELAGSDVIGKVAVSLENRNTTDRVANELEKKFSAASLPLSTRTWKELSSFYSMLRGFFTLIFGFLVIVVSVLVFFIVLQVLTMSFLERSREIGTVRALGTLQGEVFRMFTVESLILGVLGGIIGLGVGVLIALVFNGIGFNWTPPGSVEPVILKVKMSWRNTWPPFLISLLATVISSIYPAYRMSKTDIVDALRVEE